MKEKELPSGYIANNVQAVGYSDLNGRPAFKMSIREHDGHWYLYTGHFWHSGWSIIDVTDPSAPSAAKFISGPENTFTLQMELSDNIMVTALEKIFPKFGGRGKSEIFQTTKIEDFGGNPNKPYEEGVLIWDISDPANPTKLGHFRTGGTGTHRNFYSGGRYVHLAAGMPGYDGNIYVIIDISDPAQPVEAGRWWVPGQHIAGWENPSKPYVSLHGPPYVVGSLAYLPYGSAGMIVLDISDVSKPVEIGQLSFSPPFHLPFGIHSVLPLPEKGLAYVNSEDTSYGKGPLHHASIVDISDPSNPMLCSLFPGPIPPEGAPYHNFFEKGGWSGPHNINLLQHNPDVEKQGELFYIAHFNAGLRVYNVADPRMPVEVGYFMPPEPTERYGPMPEGKLVMQTEDVLVDRRGFIYVTDKNQGLWILKYEK